MTREEAIEKFSHTRFHMMGERRSESWIDMFAVLGILKLDPPRQTLWELLRKHGVALDKAQAICNDAMNNRVTVPCSPQVTNEVRHD